MTTNPHEPTAEAVAPCCGKLWTQHLGIQGTCEQLKALRERIVELEKWEARWSKRCERLVTDLEKAVFKGCKLYDAVEYLQRDHGNVGQLQAVLQLNEAMAAYRSSKLQEPIKCPPNHL